MSVGISLFLFLFLISIASSFGVPVWETIFVISSGSILNTYPEYFFLVILIFSGLIIGDVSAYTVASYFETGIVKKLNKYDWYMKTYKLSESFFNKYGALSVFLSRFLLLELAAPLNYLAGFSKYPFKKFLISTTSGELLYAIIYTYIGFAFRGSSFSILNVIIIFSLIGILVLISTLALIMLKKYLIDRRENQ